ncbi:unnamed protein product [Protopolystoma xenopodis]|uniref:Uncharacterized protein n=1 Tax=Protopolystoma xenopodis TaxID=117903 RepID=A0A3S5CHU7_9PLAT|nr:unnamed protein product [Protopolystoma xenopodis]
MKMRRRGNIKADVLLTALVQLPPAPAHPVQQTPSTLHSIQNNQQDDLYAMMYNLDISESQENSPQGPIGWLEIRKGWTGR